MLKNFYKVQLEKSQDTKLNSKTRLHDVEIYV